MPSTANRLADFEPATLTRHVLWSRRVHDAAGGVHTAKAVGKPTRGATMRFASVAVQTLSRYGNQAVQFAARYRRDTYLGVAALLLGIFQFVDVLRDATAMTLPVPGRWWTAAYSVSIGTDLAVFVGFVFVGSGFLGRHESRLEKDPSRGPTVSPEASCCCSGRGPVRPRVPACTLRPSLPRIPTRGRRRLCHARSGGVVGGLGVLGQEPGLLSRPSRRAQPTSGLGRALLRSWSRSLDRR